MAIRTARGYDAVHHPYQELYQGTRPSLQGLKAAKFLPVALVDKLHDDDPIVLLPGTFVGLLNTGANRGINGGAADTTFGDVEEAARRLVPAHQVAYTITYTAFDSDFGTPDIDAAGADVSAAGTSTKTVGPIKPIGVVAAPVYSSALPDKFTNYSRDLTPSVLCGNYNVVIPAITANEKTIEPGDRVVIDDTASADHDPTQIGAATTNVAGRVRAWDSTANTGAGAADLQGEYVVGRCVHKWVIAVGTASTKLSADLTAGTTLTSVDTTHGYGTLKRVQTVPGLGLSGSETQGVPAMFKHAYSDAGGYYYALEIRVDL